MPRSRIRLPLALFLLGALSSGVGFGAKKWVKIQSAHFELYTPAGEGRGRDAIRYFERIRQFFGSAITPRLPDRRVTIIAFNSNKDFEPYRPNDSAIAFYMDGIGRDYIVMGRTSADARGIAVHEFVHLLVRHSRLELPAWLNEGLAELYSTLAPVANKVRVGDVPPGRLAHLHQKGLMPLEELTAAGLNSPYYNEKNRAGLFYSQSWALTHMVSLSKQYIDGSSKLVIELANGASAGDAFQRVYGKSLEDVQKDLRGYIHGDRFRAAIFDVKMEESGEDVVVEPAHELETQLVLAQLLANGRKDEQARLMYEELVQNHPQTPVVREALAYFHLRNNRRDEAKQQFRKAVELNSLNAKLHFDYALLLREDGVPNSEVIPLFQRAAQLDYDLQEAHLYLGYLLMDESEFEKALLAFAKLKRVSREQAVSLYRAKAYAHLRMENTEQAEEAVGLAKKYAVSPSEIASVAELERRVRWTGPESQASETASFDPEAGPGRPRVSRAERTSETESEARPARVQLPEVETLAGTLEHFECLGATARMKVATGDEVKSFVISDPGHVVVMGAEAESFEFTCGPQNSRPLTIQYEPHANAENDTIGEVRAIHLE